METTSPTPSTDPNIDRSLLMTAFTSRGRIGRARYSIYLMSYAALVILLAQICRIVEHEMAPNMRSRLRAANNVRVALRCRAAQVLR